MYKDTEKTVREGRIKATAKAKKESLKAISKLNVSATVGGKVITPKLLESDSEILLDDLQIRNWNVIKHKKLFHDVVERFDNPISIAIAFNEYVDWARRTPFLTKEMIKSGLVAGKEFIKTTVRPITIDMFLAKCGMTKSVWERKKKTVGMTEVCEGVEQLISANQIEGGLVGVLDANLVAKLNRLGDNVTITHQNAINVDISIDGKRLPNTIELE